MSFYVSIFWMFHAEIIVIIGMLALSKGRLELFSPVLSRCQGSVAADIGGMVRGEAPQLDSTSLPW